MKKKMDKTFVKCFACDYETNSRILLKRHSIDHFDNLIECLNCSFKTNKIKILKIHLKRHFKKCLLFECARCGFESFSQNKLKMHSCFKTRRKCKIYKCFICKCLLDLRYDYRCHLEIHEVGFKICKYDITPNICNLKTNAPKWNLKKEFTRSLKKCPLCLFETNQVSMLRRHILEHLDKEFKCSYCNYYTQSLQELDRHIQDHNLNTLGFKVSFESQQLSIKVHKCFKCDFQTISNADLKEHYRIAHFIYRPKGLNEFDMEEKSNYNDKENDKNINKSYTGEFKPENFCLKCPKCKFIAKDNEELKFHKRKHYKTQYFKCPECDVETSKRFFNKHLRTHSIKTYKCPCCPYGANKLPHLKRHILVMHTGSKLLKCSKCSFETTDRKDYREHCLTHSKQVSQCPICHYIIKTIYFRRHLMTHSNIRLFRCPLCSYKAKFKKHLKTHTDIMHSSVKWFQCEHCKYQTLDQIDLKNHMFLNHAPIRCPHCEFEASSKSKFNSHMMTHTDIKIKEDPTCKIVYCSHCEYSTTQIARLQSHILTHLNKFKCSHCDYVTHHRGHLNMHLKSHNSNKLLKCPTCNYESTRTGHMNRHLKIHSELKLVCCPKCSYRTKSKEYLKHHLQTHEPKDLKCPQCNYRTNRQSLLRKHLKHHKIL